MGHWRSAGRKGGGIGTCRQAMPTRHWPGSAGTKTQFGEIVGPRVLHAEPDSAPAKADANPDRTVPVTPGRGRQMPGPARNAAVQFESIIGSARGATACRAPRPSSTGPRPPPSAQSAPGTRLKGRHTSLCLRDAVGSATGPHGPGTPNLPVLRFRSSPQLLYLSAASGQSQPVHLGAGRRRHGSRNGMRGPSSGFLLKGPDTPVPGSRRAAPVSQRPLC